MSEIMFLRCACAGMYILLVFVGGLWAGAHYNPLSVKKFTAPKPAPESKPDKP